MSAPVACRLAKADEKARVVEFLDAHWGSRHPLVHLDDFFNHYYVHDGRLQFAFAEQVGEAVAQMCADEPKLNGDLIAKEKFIRLLLPFLVRLEKGKGIDNLRLNINEAWAVYKRNRREKGL